MRTSAISWQHYSTGIAPSFVQPKADGAILRANDLAPLHYATSNAIYGEIPLALAVAHLVFRHRPLEIAFFVMTVYVDAIKTMFRRGLETNFIKKFRKRVKPKFNPASSIMRIAVHRGVSAAIFRRVVGFILSRTFPNTALSVCNEASRSRFRTPTPARFSGKRAQFTRGWTGDIAAFALAKPMMVGAPFARIPQDRQPRKHTASPVLKKWTTWVRFKNNVIFCKAHSAFSFVESIWVRVVEASQVLLRPASILPQVEVCL